MEDLKPTGSLFIKGTEFYNLDNLGAFILRQERTDVEVPPLTLAVIENREKLNELLKRIEVKYLNKLIDFFKAHHFLKNLTKNTLTKFIMKNAGRGYGSLYLYKINTIAN